MYHSGASASVPNVAAPTSKVCEREPLTCPPEIRWRRGYNSKECISRRKQNERLGWSLEAP